MNLARFLLQEEISGEEPITFNPKEQVDTSQPLGADYAPPVMSSAVKHVATVVFVERPAKPGSVDSFFFAMVHKEWSRCWLVEGGRRVQGWIVCETT